MIILTSVCVMELNKTGEGDDDRNNNDDLRNVQHSV